MVKREKDKASLRDVVFRKANKNAKYDYIPADDQRKAELRVLEGRNPQISPWALARAVRTAAVWRRKDISMEKARLIQEGREERLVAFADKYDGVRGIGFRALSRIVRVYPKTTKSEIDINALKKKLGTRAESVISEDIVLTAKLPLGTETRLGPLTPEMARMAAFAGFIALGINPEDEDTILTDKVDSKIDYDALHQIIQEGDLDIEDTGKAEQSWVVDHASWKPRPLAE